MGAGRFPDSDGEALEFVAEILGEVIGTDSCFCGACAAVALAEVAAQCIRDLRAELVELRGKGA